VKRNRRHFEGRSYHFGYRSCHGWWWKHVGRVQCANDLIWKEEP
jgi:hypothetical protein